MAAMIGFIIAVAIAEVGVRVLDIPPRPLEAIPLDQYRLSSNPILRYEYVPGLSLLEARGDHWSTGFSTNSHGFRDRERSVEKAADTRRVVVLGDSVAAGNGIRSSEKIFPQLLEEFLNASSELGRWEVLNMGVGGYHTLQEVETLRVKGLAYQPDIVFIAFCVNDFWPNADNMVYGKLLARNPDFDPSLATRSVLGRLLERSRLAFVVYHRVGEAFGLGPTEDRYEKRFLRGRSPVEAGLDLLVDIQREASFEAVVLIVPAFTHSEDRYPFHKIHERVRKIAARHPEIRVLDLTGSFAASNPDLRVFSEDGVHPNELGHETLARFLHREILSTRTPGRAGR